MSTQAEEGRVYTVTGQDWDEIVAAADQAGDEPGADRLVINMGPQHPSTHGVLRLVLELDGEVAPERKRQLVQMPADMNAQIGDQVSWTRGKHSVRFGGEFEQVNWFWDYLGLSHGITAFQTFNDFLIGLPGGCGAASGVPCRRSTPAWPCRAPGASWAPAASSTLKPLDRRRERCPGHVYQSRLYLEQQ